MTSHTYQRGKLAGCQWLEMGSAAERADISSAYPGSISFHYSQPAVPG